MDLMDTVETARTIALRWDRGQFRTLQNELNLAFLDLARARAKTSTFGAVHETVDEVIAAFQEASLRELLVWSDDEMSVMIFRAATFAAEKLGEEKLLNMARLSVNKGDL